VVTHSVVTTAGADVGLESGRLPPEDGIAVVHSTAGLSIDRRRVVNRCVVPESDVGRPGSYRPDREGIIACVVDDTVLDKDVAVLAMKVCA
jgi:hypothetical protein